MQNIFNEHFLISVLYHRLFPRTELSPSPEKMGVSSSVRKFCNGADFPMEKDWSSLFPPASFWGKIYWGGGFTTIPVYLNVMNV